MNPSGDYNHQQGADYGSGHYRPELGGDDIEVKHESYTGRYEEEAQVGNQEVGHTLHWVQGMSDFLVANLGNFKNRVSNSIPMMLEGNLIPVKKTISSPKAKHPKRMAH